jgi:hypothetical protein
LVQKHIRCRPKQEELRCAGPLAASHVDLSAEGLEQVRHLLDFIKDDKFADLFIQIQIGLCQDPSICVAFQIKVHGWALSSYLEGEGGLANLPRPQEDNSRLSVEGGLNGLSSMAMIHTLQLLHVMEDLQGYFAQPSKPSLSARSSSIFTEEGCQLVRPRGVRSRIASSRVQIA